MSQHHFPAPVAGNTLPVTVGYDPQLAEFFAMTHPALEDTEFTSMPTGSMDALEAELLAKVGVTIPEAIKNAVLGDYADFRLGASDVGRRVFQYDAMGAVVEAAVL
ncbi:MAG: hypothetical protein V4684_04355 [Pseudomonadota bacterium]